MDSERIDATGGAEPAWRPVMLQRWRRDPAAWRLLNIVCERTGVSMADMLSDSRGRIAIASARQFAMYLTNVCLNRTHTEVGRLFGRDRTTVKYACARLEDRRDEPALEAEIETIEHLLSAYCTTGNGRDEEVLHAVA